MTDGRSNVGKYEDLEKYYKNNNSTIPIYSILFGNAKKDQLDDIAILTNGKVFDGRTDLLKAFKEVRGYN
jgi:Ca-activated chloride channel family protein